MSESAQPMIELYAQVNFCQQLLHDLLLSNFHDRPNGQAELQEYGSKLVDRLRRQTLPDQVAATPEAVEAAMQVQTNLIGYAERFFEGVIADMKSAER